MYCWYWQQLWRGLPNSGDLQGRFHCTLYTYHKTPSLIMFCHITTYTQFILIRPFTVPVSINDHTGAKKLPSLYRYISWCQNKPAVWVVGTSQGSTHCLLKLRNCIITFQLRPNQFGTCTMLLIISAQSFNGFNCIISTNNEQTFVDVSAFSRSSSLACVLHQSHYSSVGVQNHLGAHFSFFWHIGKKMYEQQ